MSSSSTRCAAFLLATLLLGSCAHVHSSRWLDDEVVPDPATRELLSGEPEEFLVRVDWEQLVAEDRLVVTTWRGVPGREETDYKTRLRQRVSSYGVGDVFLRAIGLPFYLLFLQPFFQGEDHLQDGEVGVFDKLRDFVAWVNPLEALPVRGAKTEIRIVDQGRRTEVVYSGRPVPFATVHLELRVRDLSIPLVVVTDADGTGQLDLARQLGSWRGPASVRASWDSPGGTVEVRRPVYL